MSRMELIAFAAQKLMDKFIILDKIQTFTLRLDWTCGPVLNLQSSELPSALLK